MSPLAGVLKAAVVAEVGAVLAGYFVFHKLNTDVAFRSWVGTACPSCLDTFCVAVTGLGYSLPPDLVAFRTKLAAPPTDTARAAAAERRR